METAAILCTLTQAMPPVKLLFSGLYNRIWDEADYVVPPAENGAFFVATNVIITPNQRRGNIS